MQSVQLSHTRPASLVWIVPRRDRHWRGAGLAVPVFSLRTQHSVGVGEFLDLMPLVDLADRWGRSAHMAKARPWCMTYLLLAPASGMSCVFIGAWRTGGMILCVHAL